MTNLTYILTLEETRTGLFEPILGGVNVNMSRVGAGREWVELGRKRVGIGRKRVELGRERVGIGVERVEWDTYTTQTKPPASKTHSPIIETHPRMKPKPRNKTSLNLLTISNIYTYADICKRTSAYVQRTYI